MISILLDTREKDLINSFNLQNLEFKVKCLDIGDIHFIDSDSGKVQCIVERKTMTDLSNSIKDGRSREQKIRLLEYCKEHSVKLIYLIEGGFNIHGLPKSTLMSAIVNKIIRDNIFIIRSKGITESVEFILKLQKKITEHGNGISNSNGNSNCTSNDLSNSTNSDSTKIDYISTIKPKKKDNLDQRNVFKLQLMCIPKISSVLATAIVDKYSSITDLLENIENVNEIEYNLKTRDSSGNFKKRKVGNAVQSSIKTYLLVQDSLNKQNPLEQNPLDKQNSLNQEGLEELEQDLSLESLE